GRVELDSRLPLRLLGARGRYRVPGSAAMLGQVDWALFYGTRQLADADQDLVDPGLRVLARLPPARLCPRRFRPGRADRLARRLGGASLERSEHARRVPRSHGGQALVKRVVRDADLPQ